MQPRDQIPLFSLQDMRFFQHFLFQCYPHHPIGSEDLWTNEIPCLSHKASRSTFVPTQHSSHTYLTRQPTEKPSRSTSTSCTRSWGTQRRS